MAEISEIKLPNNNSYKLRDDVHTWGGRNLLVNTDWKDENVFTNNKNITGWYGLDPEVDTLDTSFTHRGHNSIRRLRNGTTSLSWSSFRYYCRDNNILVPNEQYTLSWWQYAPSDEWYEAGYYLTGILEYHDDNSTSYITQQIVVSNKGFIPSTVATWEHRAFTFTAPTEVINHTWWELYFRAPGDVDLYLTQFKLEHGNKSTDWSPAPEDIAYVSGTQLNLLS